MRKVVPVTEKNKITTNLRPQIAQVIKDRRVNYSELANVSDETCDALSAWIMDEVIPELQRCYKLGVQEWNDHLIRAAEQAKANAGRRTAAVL